MLLALHSAMGEGHSCSTSVWQVYPLTTGFPFPVCASLMMGWAKSSESWETLNVISKSEASGSCVFSHMVRWFCYSLGYLVSLLGVHYVWTKGRSEGKRNGWYQTQLLGEQNPMSHSIAGFYLYTTGAVPLQIRGKWTTKKKMACFPSCKQHQKPQTADYSAGIYVSILFLVITN